MPLLECHPQELVSWEEFKRCPAPAVALDGYVEGPARRSQTHASFDHHAGVDPVTTRATCEQVALAILLGPFPMLDDPSRVHVHINHADQDISLSIWLLDHQELVAHPRVRQLVDIEGLLDATGGCCLPVANEDFLSEVAWIFAPCEKRPRMASDMKRTIQEVGARIDRYVEGTSERRPRIFEFDFVDRRERIAAIEERGPLARMRLREHAVDMFVSLRPGDSRLDVSIGKTSPWAPYNLARAYFELNRLEGCPPEDGWGGSPTIGGSPRSAGTRLDTQVILDVLERCRDERTGPFLVPTRK